MAKYRFVGDHPDTLADGRPVAPGEFVNLSDEEVAEPHNAALIADEKFIGTGKVSKETVEKVDAAEERRLAREAREEAN